VVKTAASPTYVDFCDALGYDILLSISHKLAIQVATLT